MGKTLFINILVIAKTSSTSEHVRNFKLDTSCLILPELASYNAFSGASFGQSILGCCRNVVQHASRCFTRERLIQM